MRLRNAARGIVESGAGQTECNRVKGKPAYKELKGTGSEREQAEEAVGYYRTWQVSRQRSR